MFCIIRRLRRRRDEPAELSSFAICVGGRRIPKVLLYSARLPGDRAIVMTLPERVAVEVLGPLGRGGETLDAQKNRHKRERPPNPSDVQIARKTDHPIKSLLLKACPRQT